MTSLHQYVRDRKNNPIGVVVAIKIGDKIHCGWSLTKISSGDRFNKETGLSMAIGRAVSHVSNPDGVPHTAKKYFSNIKERAARYFKDAQFADGITF